MPMREANICGEGLRGQVELWGMNKIELEIETLKDRGKR